MHSDHEQSNSPGTVAAEQLLDHLTTVFAGLLMAEGHRILRPGNVVVQLLVGDVINEPDDQIPTVPSTQSAAADDFVDVPLGYLHEPDDYLCDLELDLFATSGPRRFAMQIDLNGLGCRVNDVRGWWPDNDLWLRVEQQAGLLEIGWVPPSVGVPLWWVFVGSAEAVGEAAEAVIAPVADVREVPVQVIAADLGVRPPKPEAAAYSPALDAGRIVRDPTGLLWDYAHFAMQQQLRSPSHGLSTTCRRRSSRSSMTTTPPWSRSWWPWLRWEWTSLRWGGSAGSATAGCPDPTRPQRMDHVTTEKLRARSHSRRRGPSAGSCDSPSSDDVPGV